MTNQSISQHATPIIIKTKRTPLFKVRTNLKAGASTNELNLDEIAGSEQTPVGDSLSLGALS